MTTLSIRLPQSLHAAAKSLAEREGVSVNQLITAALTEKVAAVAAYELLRARAAKGSIPDALALLGRAPDIEADAADMRRGTRPSRRKVSR
jgi:hypothetical protein